ncbi:hypothetical protein CHS0354_023134 [Potamilus streckersoni]|uniref:C-type lectin domain-containing protein n=1 Tax=Potamilus streckersoni TaxID=2493646 RepID=A0AAE0VGD0_9BIVA|nr:hypothetical protein CHS0354_023134 [Potamilus streckersoni]
MASRRTLIASSTLCLLLIIESSAASYPKPPKHPIKITAKSASQLLNLILLVENRLKTTACPQNYNLYDKGIGGRFCYRFVADFCRNQSAAQKYCQNQGGNLISLNESNFEFFRLRAAEERDFSDQQKGTHGPNLQTCRHFWTSASDYGRETRFRFISGLEIDPNSAVWVEPVVFNTGKNCVVMDGNNQYLLTDFNCALQMASPLCQIFL